MSEDAALYGEAESLLRYANDVHGNAGLVYGRCIEHDWRSRKRNVNNVYAESGQIRALAVEDTLAHLRAKHSRR